MFSLLSTLLELACISYVVWVGLSLYRYLDTNSKGLEEPEVATDNLVQRLLLPVKVYNWLLAKAKALLSKYGLL